MAMSNTSALASKSLLPSCKPHQPTLTFFSPSTTCQKKPRSSRPISAVHAAEPAKTPVSATATTKAAPKPAKWSVESWKSKKALQLPEYPDEGKLDGVLKTIEAFPPLVFAGEARSLEEKLAQAAMGNAFLLQGGDCAESFKEFNANYIRDTFRILLQMSAVLTFGGQMPVIKVHFCIQLCGSRFVHLPFMISSYFWKWELVDSIQDSNFTLKFN